MKCLSLWQPWASLLVHGSKQVETRGWPIHYRGPLLIHAAKKWDDDLMYLCRAEPFKSALAAIGVLIDSVECDRPGSRPWRERVQGLSFGAIVGRVNVVDCVPTHSVAIKGKPGEKPGFFTGWIDSVLARHLVINNVEKAFGDYSAGRFAFLCSDPIAFAKPIPFRGMQGLFDVPNNLAPTQGA